MASDYPVTMAIRVLRQHGVEFTPHRYTWQPHGGTLASATRELTRLLAPALVEVAIG
jgi:hypothetical protein